MNIDDLFTSGDPFLQHFLPGQSPGMSALRGTIYNLNVAHKNNRMVRSILLLGERGVGKGYTTRVISAHLRALRSGMNAKVTDKFDDIYALAVQAGLREQALTAIPEAQIEASLFGAKKGSYTGADKDRVGLFDSKVPIDVLLDEIGDAPPELQAKLLDVLETGRFRPLGLGFDEPTVPADVRVIAATNRDLRKLAGEGLFRRDLFDRLMWMPIVLPPLREQRDQLPLILKRINHDLCRDFDLAEIVPADGDIFWCKTEYSWPGNHRELKQVLWFWHVQGRKSSLKEIVQQRHHLLFPAEETEGLEDVVVAALFRHFDAVLKGTTPGFSSVGDVPDCMRKITYKALWLFKEQHRLSNEDLERMFPGQKAKNIRTLISDNRPEKEGNGV